MNRKITSIIRFIMDEFLPAIIRDNKYFMYPFFYIAYGGKNVNEAMNFKKNVYNYTAKQYEHFYQNLNSISRNRVTDLNQNCIDSILNTIKSIKPSSVIDVGCGNGFMLNKIHSTSTGLELLGLDIQENVLGNFQYRKEQIENINIPDNSIDLVICSHVIEHILKPEKAIEELKRIAKKALIIVVPKQRFFYYTLDEHVNFFQFKEQLTSLVNLDNFNCTNIDGDWFFVAHLDK